ncbi:TadE/TadG family type IV pilus assembly protein [Methylotuvimicrobium alcaliphilum]|uniref:Exported protein n=1 Tax=Methylotuvimicrobium alcaliphilum (strain DSM 19304 / NCIMB 14124 / VKM B-2133 / 20Z) TaxID=1091494 RepID=G4T3P1_META2|nr:TadE/TadG family type IV pilus assembly protein [Methylotuvimicrobium alcaliphilum]CCE24847.1 putative exported protein [Methylotuvimicrobium alcaliphilum 20Z]
MRQVASPIGDTNIKPPSGRLRGQRGAAAIEAALLFVIFFTLFYAIVSYSIPMMMMQVFNHAASAGARAGVAVERSYFDDEENAEAAYLTGVEARVRDVVEAFLDDTLLPSARANADVNLTWDNDILIVTVRYAGYRANPLVPILRFPVIGDVPRVPDDLIGRAAVQVL